MTTNDPTDTNAKVDAIAGELMAISSILFSLLSRLEASKLCDSTEIIDAAEQSFVRAEHVTRTGMDKESHFYEAGRKMFNHIRQGVDLNRQLSSTQLNFGGACVPSSKVLFFHNCYLLPSVKSKP